VNALNENKIKIRRKYIMKEKKENKKSLKLKKETLSMLSPEELRRLLGGDDVGSKPTVYNIPGTETC
jgi:natural product precursor